MAPSFADPSNVASHDVLADIDFAAQPSPPALTHCKGSAIQILLDRLVWRGKEFSRLEDAIIDCKVRLECFQEQIALPVGSQKAPRLERYATRCKSVSQDEKMFSSCQTVHIFQASVVELTSTCNTLCFEVTAHNSVVAALRAQTLIVASGQSQLKYDAVVRRRDHSDSILHSLAENTSLLEDDVANPFYHTWASPFVRRRRVQLLFVDFRPQPDPTDDKGDDGSAPIG